jgi:hypothetical protein
LANGTLRRPLVTDKLCHSPPSGWAKQAGLRCTDYNPAPFAAMMVS